MSSETFPGLESAESIVGLPRGVSGWTTTRSNGSYGLGSDESVGSVMSRWARLEADLAARGIDRLACAHQVHGAVVSTHSSSWSGWLRQRGVDGHISTAPGSALAVTVADCTPVFIAHPAGAIAVLHAGWRGTAAHILAVGLEQLARLGFPSNECVVHLGPAICGPCYEVGPEVLEAVTGRASTGKGHLDTRAVLAEQATTLGVQDITISPFCTRCHNDRFYSHRAGDTGRQLGVIALASS